MNSKKSVWRLCAVVRSENRGDKKGARGRLSKNFSSCESSARQNPCIVFVDACDVFVDACILIVNKNKWRYNGAFRFLLILLTLFLYRINELQKKKNGLQKTL